MGRLRCSLDKMASKHPTKRNVPFIRLSILGILLLTLTAWVRAEEHDSTHPRFAADLPKGCTPSWEIVESPNPGSNSNHLLAVSVLSASDIWAVGDFRASSGSSYQLLTIHWDGSTWSLIPSPSFGGDAILRAVAAVSTSDVWVFGAQLNVGPLILRWDGTQ